MASASLEAQQAQHLPSAGFWHTTFSLRNWPAWLAFALCLSLTASLLRIIQADAQVLNAVRMQLISAQIVKNIQDRLQAQEQILLGGAALLEVSSKITRMQWHDFVARLALDNRYPGVQGMGFARYLPASSQDAFVAARRAEGFSNFQIKPAGEREVYTAIEYLEPFEGRNLAAFGYDMFTESTRRLALERAVEMATSSLSGKVTLVQETHGNVQAGILIFVPVFRQGALLDKVSQRWQALQGWVYSPFRMDDLMTPLLASYFDRLTIDIFDGDDISATSLLFTNSAHRDQPTYFSVLPMQQIVPMDVLGHRWTVRTHPGRNFFSYSNPLAEISFVLAGIVVAVLLFFMLRFFRFRSDEAEAMALRMTHEIRDKERQSHETAQRIQAVLDNVVDGIITLDDSGIILSVNPAVEHIFGWSAIDLLGQSVEKLMPESPARQHDHYMKNYQESGVARIFGIGRELEGVRRDGSVFTMDISVSEITVDGRHQYIGVVRDITERKRIECMKNEFVSTVSHELRTPLTSIGGALGLITGGALGEPPAPMKGMLDVALNNCQRLTLLINDLLDMEKIAAGKLSLDCKPHALVDLMESALSANQTYAAQKPVHFRLTRCDNEKVVVDALRFAQIMSNFLSNAVKFSPPHADILVSAVRREHWVRIAVEDKGPGIPEHFKPHVFEKFSQADASDTRQKGGTGLGLAITRELVELMGGHIGFETTPGIGSTFWCELPAR